MFDERSKYFAEVADCILGSDGSIYKATKFISDKLTIKGTRKRYKCYNGKPKPKGQAIDIVFTVGKPNYEEREMIKKFKKSGFAFPVRTVYEKRVPSK